MKSENVNVKKVTVPTKTETVVKKADGSFDGGYAEDTDKDKVATEEPAKETPEDNKDGDKKAGGYDAGYCKCPNCEGTGKVKEAEAETDKKAEDEPPSPGKADDKEDKKEESKADPTNSTTANANPLTKALTGKDLKHMDISGLFDRGLNKVTPEQKAFAERINTEFKITDILGN